MRHCIWLLFILLAFAARAQYVPDVLGDGYARRTFRMADDKEGKVVCTLVRKARADSVRQAVLYLHGYNDYFFQKELGDSLNAYGYNFYALDLRKYGRSMRPHQDPFFCESLSEYFADVDTALATIRAEGNERVFLMAHSTGGLIASYYLGQPGKGTAVNGLILNSPFLDWNLGWWLEEIAIPVVAWLGRWWPGLTVQGTDRPNYAYSLLRGLHGEWTFDTAWKMPFGHPKKAGWIRAIHEAQKFVQRGLDLDCPILLLSSDHSFPDRKGWDEAYKSADIVLDVDDIRRYGETLGQRVTYQAIPNGMHDLILSTRPARDSAYRAIADWLKQQE